MLKRLFDITMSIAGILLTSPIILVIYIAIKLTSNGPGFFIQERVGLYGKPFKIIKFRTMHKDADKLGLLSMGDSDKRITKLGKKLRKFRLDELPQFFNILTGSMSFVGPRPEVSRFVDCYTSQQRNILNFRPGVTDYACLIYLDLEDKILNKNSSNADEIYIKEIMPAKIEANLAYFSRADLISDIGIIMQTIGKTFKRGRL